MVCPYRIPGRAAKLRVGSLKDRRSVMPRRHAHNQRRAIPIRCLAIVPVFNEGASVRKVVHRLRRALPEFDVLVVDDGSTDDTVRQVPTDVPVVSLPFNLGIGGAMQTGYRYAALHGYEIAVQVDGDGQHRPAEVRRLVEFLMDGTADLVVGSRFLEPSKYRQSLVRKIGARGLQLLIRTLAGQPMTDCTSGFRAANRTVIRAFAHWYPEDYPEPEVILLLKRAGFRIAEIPVKMRHRRTGRSSIGLLTGVFYVLKVAICLLLDLAREPWPSGKVGPEEEADGDELRHHSLPQPLSGGLRWHPPRAGGTPTAHV